MIAGGLYIANAHKTSPASADILREALAARGVTAGQAGASTVLYFGRSGSDISSVTGLAAHTGFSAPDAPAPEQDGSSPHTRPAGLI